MPAVALAKAGVWDEKLKAAATRTGRADAPISAPGEQAVDRSNHVPVLARGFVGREDVYALSFLANAGLRFSLMYAYIYLRIGQRLAQVQQAGGGYLGVSQTDILQAFHILQIS